MPASGPLPHGAFVYQTLKRGFPNHHPIPEAELAGPWYTPILISEPGGHRVAGDLHRIDDAGMAHLNDMEGVGHEFGFDRIQVEVDRAGGWSMAFAKPRDRIDIIPSEPLEEYHLDPRCVPGGRRGQENSGFGLRG